MSAVLGYVAMMHSGANAVHREFDRAATAGARIARAGAAEPTDTVKLSPEALAHPPDTGDSLVGGIEQPMVDLRVAKYTAVANMKVINTADEMAKEVSNLVK